MLATAYLAVILHRVCASREAVRFLFAFVLFGPQIMVIPPHRLIHPMLVLFLYWRMLCMAKLIVVCSKMRVVIRT